MSQFNSLLVALDFRQINEAVCREAILLAKKMKAEVTLIHVIEYLSYYPYYPYDQEKVYNDLHQEINNKLDIFSKQFAKEGVYVHPHIIKQGKTHKMICESADEIDACGIVLGVGDHYLLENLIGSTADKVTKMAKQAVIMINPQKHQEGLSRVLCAYDFSENADRALGSAIYLAKLFNAPLDLVHVIQEHYYFNPVSPVIDPASPVFTDHISEIENAKETVRDKINETLDKLDIEGINFEIHIRKGEPVIEISKLIENLNTSLLVVGANGHNAFASFFLGSTTEKLLRKAPCSIMTLKNEHK